MTAPDNAETIQWDADPLTIHLVVREDRVVRLRSIVPIGQENTGSQSKHFEDASLPLVEVRLAGEGTEIYKTSKSLVGGYTSGRLQYQSHRAYALEGAHHLEITSQDPVSQITLMIKLTVYNGVPVLRSQVTLINQSTTDVTLSQVSSLTVGNLSMSSKDWSREYKISYATNSWFREAQWRDDDLFNVGLGDSGHLELGDGHRAGWGSFSISNRGGFSSGSYLPMGLLKRNDQGETWLWQVEHNGSWRWEVGDYQDSLYASISGPTGPDHSCWTTLKPGQTFETVPAAVCHVFSGADAAFAAMTEYRRRIRRAHTDNQESPVIFNDFMNCLMGDLTEDKINALLEPVARSGAEYYVIDAGWYADEAEWWDSVGAWEPSAKRFPSGFEKLVENIKKHGLRPGLWLEPEVVGVRSPTAQQLPEEAFFQNYGRRVYERDRYHLDYRHPAVIQRMNAIVDGLIERYGIQYFKFDYNIEVTTGTDGFGHGQSAGEGHLGHCRAYLAWINGIYDRHPHIVLENCSSGGQRMDYASLSVFSLQSTSDQQDPFRYAAIAAAVPTAATPEQGASWAYPQPDWSDEKNALSVVNSLLGRVHLSGKIHLLSAEQFALVAEGMAVFKTIRRDLGNAVPFWPLGLPSWYDDWISLGMAAPGVVYISVWRRGGPTVCKMKVPIVKGNVGLKKAELLYPLSLPADIRWTAESRELSIELPRETCARLLRLA